MKVSKRTPTGRWSKEKEYGLIIGSWSVGKGGQYVRMAVDATTAGVDISEAEHLKFVFTKEEIKYLYEQMMRPNGINNCNDIEVGDKVVNMKTNEIVQCVSKDHPYYEIEFQRENGETYVDNWMNYGIPQK